MAEEGFKRKLTAILSADVEGYSRFMGDDEEATVRTLTAYREVLYTLIRQHNPLGEFQERVDIRILFYWIFKKPPYML